jgi:CRISPR-associated endonuclease/helicase Cas3
MAQEMDFTDFFTAGAGFAPYPWQVALGTRPEPAVVISAPTGSGKTEAVILDWLWRRRTSPEATPRRLVIALPMRVLVDQTVDRARNILDRLGKGGLLDPPPSAHVLMGGEIDDDWTLLPEADAVLIGTIDILLSRALNRGYASGRSRWPIDFGLLGSDCAWVLDEVQLMDAAVATSAQLQGFRMTLGTHGPARTVWMSATLAPGWLGTRDHPEPPQSARHTIGPDDRHGVLGRRLSAPKELVREVVPAYAPSQVGAVVSREHAAQLPSIGPVLTLAMVNTVGRAIELYKDLRARVPEADVLLVHSRFRPDDRAQVVRRLGTEAPPSGRIVVSTQVIEAGIDLDAGALVTELAPWASLAQRAGRLNRAGDRAASRLVWLDPTDLEPALARPYPTDALLICREKLVRLSRFSPDEIAAVSAREPNLLGDRPETLLLRRDDLFELFDTDPTLDGDDVDIGRYIRAQPDLDVAVCWRDLDDTPSNDEPLPSRSEICPVPISERKAVAALDPWRWDYAGRRWDQVRQDSALRPGDLLLVPSTRGGYTQEVGWSPGSRTFVPPLAPNVELPTDSDAADPLSSYSGGWLSVSAHTDHVVEETKRIVGALGLPSHETEALLRAARLHDAGKSHEAFQARLEEAAGELPSGGPWAKAPRRPGTRPPRTVFRHEVASALALLELEGRERSADLSAYLVAAHHGKMRLSPRVVLDDLGRAVESCLGVKHGDQLPRVDLGGGFVLDPLRIDLALFALGSFDDVVWLERTLDLLDTLGPFRLAYLEALLRSADQRASRAEAAL